MTNEPAPDDLLLSDADRLHALNVLGEHYAAGRLNSQEFDERSGEIALARTLSATRPAFRGLPGGVPLEHVDDRIRVITHGEESVPAGKSVDAEAELTTLRRRGGAIESLDWAIIGATLLAFLVLQSVVRWDYAWVVWPSLILTLSLPRVILRFDDSDEKIYHELKRSEKAARRKRLRRAAERIRELDGTREPDKN